MTPRDTKTPRVEWAGGECPVHPEAVVVFEAVGGGTSYPLPACRFFWGRTGHDQNIAAFWVISSPNPDDIARYQPREDSMDEGRVTFPPDVSGEPCDGVVLVLDDGSEVAFPLPGEGTVSNAINAVYAAIREEGWFAMQQHGRIIPTRRIVDVFAVVGGKVVGRG